MSVTQQAKRLNETTTARNVYVYVTGLGFKMFQEIALGKVGVFLLDLVLIGRPVQNVMRIRAPKPYKGDGMFSKGV